MSRPRRLASLRRHAIIKVGALFFVTLIILPFTAPFPTIDLASSPAGTAAQALPKIKGSDEKCAVVSDWLLVTPNVSLVEIRQFALSSQIDEHSALFTVLRL